MQKTMQAIVKAKPELGLWLEEVPVPEVGSDDVLIRTLKASICGTDVHIYNWDAWAQKTIPIPMTIGHEFVGKIDRVGSNVRGFAEGDLVVGEGHITCGHCRNCLAGRRHLCPVAARYAVLDFGGYRLHRAVRCRRARRYNSRLLRAAASPARAAA